MAITPPAGRRMGFDLQGKTVLITGASSGIGRACASAFHAAGSNVILAARSEEKLREIAANLGEERALDCPADVTRDEDRRRIVENGAQRFGHIDVLLNNAGWAAFAPLLQTDEAHLDTMTKLNVLAPLALARLCASSMIQRGFGQIINIASVVGHQPIPRMAFYSATKAALVSLSSSLRMELAGTGVDVLLVCPGSTRTDFFDAAASKNVRSVRFKRTQYTPERVARAVVTSSRKRRKSVTLSAEAKAIVAIRRVSVRLADTIMNKVAARAMPETKD